MNAVQKYNWNKTRQKGKSLFILRQVLIFGFFGTFLLIMLHYFYEFFFDDTPNYLHKSNEFVGEILLRLIIFLMSGFIVGYYWWNKNEAEFLQNSEK